MTDGAWRSPVEDETEVRSGPTRTDVMDRLRGFSRYRDGGAGFVEEQLFIETGGQPLFGTLVEPLDGTRSIGFVTCHSFGHEQMELFPLELLFARSAAARGFPALVFHSRGYGDSGGDLERSSLGGLVSDATAACRFLTERAGVPAAVPVGARLGSSVALMTAAALASPGVVLWDPALRPGKYLDTLLRASLMSALVDEDGSADTSSSLDERPDPRAALAAGQTVDVFGYPLAADAYREAHVTDPIDERVPSRAMVVLVNRRRRREVERAAARIADAGGDVRIEDANGPGREEFAGGALRGGHLATHLALFADMSDRTISWAEETW